MKEQIGQLSSGTLVYGVGQVLTKLISFLLLPLLTAYLSPEDFGIISILGVFTFLAAPIFGLGLGNSIGIVYFEEDTPERRSQTIWTSLAVLSISSLLFLTASFLLAESISFLAFQTEKYDEYIKIVSIGTVFNGIINQPLIFRLQFEQKSKLFVLLTFLSTFITIGGTILFVVILEQGVEGFIKATLIGNVSTFLIYFIAVIGWTKMSFNTGLAGQLLKYGYPMIPSFIFIFIIQNSGRYILQRYFGAAEVGIYSVGNTFGMVINVAVTAFTTAWFPYFNSFVNKQNRAQLIFGKTFVYYILSMGSFCLLFFIFARPLVAMMTAPSFYEAHAIIGMISLGNCLVGAFSILTAGVYFAKKVYLVNIVQFGAALICLILNLVLVPAFGIIGAGISFFAANLAMTIFQYLINIKMDLLKIQYDWKRILHFSIMTILVMFLCLFPRSLPMIKESIISVLISIVLFFLLYAQLYKEEKSEIARIWKSIMPKIKAS